MTLFDFLELHYLDLSMVVIVLLVGSFNLGPLDPPVVSFGQDSDPYYTQYLQNWDEVEALIAELREEATKAWGSK